MPTLIPYSCPSGNLLREAAAQHLGEARFLLNVRAPNLAGIMPELVVAYE